MAIETKYPHIDCCDGRPARLARLPRVRVTQLVMDHLAFGWSVEEMCRQHRYLTPAEGHAAMAYYFDQQEEIDGEVEEELREVDRSHASEESRELNRHLPL